MQKVNITRNGDGIEVGAGGVIEVLSGGRIHLESGAILTLESGATLNYGNDGVTDANTIGSVAAVTGLSAAIERMGSLFKLTLTLAAVSVSVTDANASGSSGSLKLFDFVEGAVSFLGSRVNITATAEGAALTTAAGDAAFAVGLGTVAIAAAADGVLSAAATYTNIGAAQTITDTAGTGAGEKITPANACGAPDGTGTAADIILNVSGTAASIDASDTLSFTGTATVIGMFMGDD